MPFLCCVDGACQDVQVPGTCAIFGGHMPLVGVCADWPDVCKRSCCFPGGGCADMAWNDLGFSNCFAAGGEPGLFALFPAGIPHGGELFNLCAHGTCKATCCIPHGEEPCSPTSASCEMAFVVHCTQQIPNSTTPPNAIVGSPGSTCEDDNPCDNSGSCCVFEACFDGFEREFCENLGGDFLSQVNCAQGCCPDDPPPPSEPVCVRDLFTAAIRPEGHKPGIFKEDYHEIASVDRLRLIDQTSEIQYGKATKRVGESHIGSVCGRGVRDQAIYDCPVTFQNGANSLQDDSVLPGYAVFDCLWRCPSLN